ncbi:hypothetical protein AKG11_03780 [Shinella sp. SUS2]|uniref:DUF3102 domain-containing protein n=1 Tax=unclassified Shinella TaxID=2643062 RepID=UPI000681ADF7|nr:MULTISPECIES: DUF3102 domain-containing protein [unclassified Shinella]KNY18261.1 hypothetical protein AKG11_03780 [Shinella sp. SUS2]KOC77456.1 hypothetical protein AKG10_01250 [Shinella sp. GWS1]
MFSYAALSREDEAAAREDAALIKAHMKTAAESIIAVGLALKRQKERLPHGMFLPWIEAEFEMSHKTATSLMNVADRFQGKVETVSGLTVTALYELAAPSTPQPIRDQVEALLVDGQKVTVADIRRMKAETKAAQNGRELAALDAEAAEKKAAELEASQSEEAAKIAKRVGAGFEDELRRLRRENEELRRAASARPAPTTAASNVVALHKPLTDKEKDEIDRTHDDWEGADFDQTASMDSHVRAFLGGLDTLGTTKASAADIIKYLSKSSKAAKQMTEEAMAKAFPIIQTVKEKVYG